MANYIPDATALGFLLLALGLWWKKGELSWGSSLLLLAAGLMKPTFLLVPLSFVAARLMEILWEEKSFKGALIDQKRNVLRFGSVLLGSFVWVFYVKWYNAEVNNVYFLFEPRPIWEFDPATREAVWEHLTNKDIYRRYGYDNVFTCITSSAFSNCSFSLGLRRDGILPHCLPPSVELPISFCFTISLSNTTTTHWPSFQS
jgi:hypothetical protein